MVVASTATETRTQGELVPILWPEDQRKLRTDVEWLITDLLRKGAVGTIFGLPGSYKSWFILDAAYRIANGVGEFLGLPVERHGPVILVAADDGKETTVERLKMIARGHTGSEDYDNIALVDRGHINLTAKDAKRKLEYLVSQTKAKFGAAPELIVIDTAAMAGAPTDDFGHGYPARLGWLKEVAAEAGCAIVLVDHVSKPGPERGQLDVRSRGWGSVMKSGFFECAMSLTGRQGGEPLVDLEVSDKRSPRRVRRSLKFEFTNASYSVNWEPLKAAADASVEVIAAVLENKGAMSIKAIEEATGFGRSRVARAAKSELKVVEEARGTRAALYDVR